MAALKKRVTENMEDLHVRQFPDEVYQAHDDVTPEAVSTMRDRAKKKIEGRKWTKIDGFGLRNPF